ncbi:MAG: hypothetical protein ACO34J_08610 [Prochlorothrix sp.]
MKRFQPRGTMPNTNQFYGLVRDKVSTQGQQSFSYKAVQNLFQTAERIYRALYSCTSESLAVFKNADRYLTPQQEHDAVALTVLCVMAVSNGDLSSWIDRDPDLLPDDRIALHLTLKAFSDTVQATHNTVGHPRWVD